MTSRTEELLFLFLCAASALAFCCFMGRFPVAAKWVTLALFTAFFLFMQWAMLTFKLGASPFAEVSAVSFHTSPWALPLFALCTLAEYVLLAGLFIRPLRRALRLGLRSILLALCNIFPLQIVLWSDAFNPIFGGALGMRFSMLLAILTILLLLQQWVLERLRLRLNGYSRQFRRRRSLPAMVSPAARTPQPASAWRKRALAISGAALLLLLPLFFIEWREPKTFPPEVQRELEEIFHSETIREYSELFPPEEMADMYREFTLSDDANTRSDDWEWSMLHLSCWFRNTALMTLIHEGDKYDKDAESLQRTGQMVLFFLECGASLHEPWRIPDDIFLFSEQARMERRRDGRSIADVLAEERPMLAAWLREHGVKMEKD